ncbi:MAG: monovalent cation/H(+) antiporter subunit G [Pseudomonadota bacterium]
MISFIGFIFIFLGIFLCFSAVIGCFRFPDYFCKMHAATLGDAIGCPLILWGVAMQSNSITTALKIILLSLIILIITPTASYLLNKIALKSIAPSDSEKL